MDFIGLAPRYFDAALGDELATAMRERGLTSTRVAVFARLRPRAVRRILAGKTSAGTVQLHRLLRVLQLDHDATIKTAYVKALIAQPAAETEAAAHHHRTPDTLR